jgi:hypothetical protein
MKLKLGILFIGALILASGCARKCPPCPSCGLGAGSYGTSSSYTSAPVQSSAPSYSAPVDNTTTPSQYSSSAKARYVSK